VIAVRALRATRGRFELGPCSFTAPTGAYVAIVGPSGHGKSSLLWALTGAIPAQGIVQVDDVDWSSLAPERRRCALVPQDGGLFPHLSAAGNMGFALPRGSPRVAELARSFGVEGLLAQRASQLSGGEAMRVALARALGRDPVLLLLDEPLSAIDEAGRAPLLALLRDLRGRCTVIHVTHDLDEAVGLATHLGVMRDGKLAAFDTCEQVLLHPPTPEVAQFLGAENLLAGVFAPHGPDASTFAVGPLTLHVLARAQGPGYLSIPERAVMLALRAPEGTSARNAVPLAVRSVVIDRQGARVCLEGVISLCARVERESVAALGLVPGAQVVAVVKSAQLRVVGER